MPEYKIGCEIIISRNITAGVYRNELVYPVTQQCVTHSRTVGYFTSLADAEAYVSMATHYERMVAGADGQRIA